MSGDIFDCPAECVSVWVSVSVCTQVLLASSGQRPGMLLNILQCSRHPVTKNYLASNPGWKVCQAQRKSSANVS